MRVVHYLDRIRLELGGVVRAVLDLAAATARAGDEVTVLTHDGSDVPGEWRGGGPGVPRVVTVASPALPGGWFAPWQMGAVRSALRGADAAHVHAMWTPSNTQVAGAARREGVGYVLTPHGMLDDWSMSQRRAKKKVYLALGGRGMLERAGAVHCTASAEATQARAWFRNPRVEVAPVLFDLGPYRELPGMGASARAFPFLETGRPVLVFLSRLHEKKRPDLLLDAAGLLREGGVGVEVAIAGTGDAALEESLRAQIGRLGLEGSAHLLGMVKGVEKVSLLERGDVFVLPTSQENFGIAIVEAMACGTPVITTKGVDIWPELEGSGGAVIVDRVDAPTLAREVRALLEDGARRAAMGARAREWALRELDEGAVVERYREMYRKVAARG